MQNKWFSPSLKFLCARKLVTFVVFCWLVFVLLVGFGLIWVFVRSKSFRKKTNRFEIVLITSFTILLTYPPFNSPIENLFAYAYVYDKSTGFSYIIICQNLFLPVHIHFYLCFLSVRVHFYLYAFVWILKHQKYWYSFCWKHCDMNNFWLN